jgi:hypothetical protein
MNDDRWLSVGEYDDPEEARWTAARLAEEDIPTRVVDPLEADPPAGGPLVVLVGVDDVSRARAVLAQDAPADDTPDEPDEPDPPPPTPDAEPDHLDASMSVRQRLALVGCVAATVGVFLIPFQFVATPLLIWVAVRSGQPLGVSGRLWLWTGVGMSAIGWIRIIDWLLSL